MQLTTRSWRLTLLSAVAIMLVVLALSLRTPQSSGPSFASASERATWARRTLVMRTMWRESAAFAREAVMRTKDGQSRAGVASRGDPLTAAWQVAGADSLGATIAPAIRQFVARELGALGIVGAATPLRVIVREAMAHQLPKAAKRPAAVESYYFLPETPDDACTIVVAVWPATAGAISETLARSTGILGPCGFQLAVGSPGRVVRAWLDSVDWKPARLATWHPLPANLRAEREGWQDLLPPEVRCLSGDESACNRIWTPSPNEWGEVASSDASVLGPYSEFGQSGESRAVREAVALSDLMRDVGRESFGAWWRGDGDERAAFQTTFGVSREEWTRRWMARTYEVPVISPRPLASEVAWVVAAFGVFVAAMLLTVRRVQR